MSLLSRIRLQHSSLALTGLDLKSCLVGTRAADLDYHYIFPYVVAAADVFECL